MNTTLLIFKIVDYISNFAYFFQLNGKFALYHEFYTMHKKDQIKGIIALVVFGSIALSYFLFGKEISKYVAIAGFIAWLGGMYFLNKKS